MANLVLKALKINEQVCNWGPYSGCPLYWDISLKIFRLRVPELIQKWKLYQLVLTVGFWNTCSVYVITTYFRVPNSYTIRHLLVTVAQYLYLLACIGFNYEIYKSGSKLSEYLNRLMKFSKTIYRVTPVKTESKSDFIGTLCYFITILLSIIPWPLWAGLIKTRVGPFTLTIRRVVYLANISNFLLQYAVAFIASLLNLAVALETCRVIRMMAVILLVSLQETLETLNKLQDLPHKHVDYAIQEYRRFYATVHTLSMPAVSNALAIGFGVGYLIVVVIGTLCLFGRIFLPWSVYFIGPVTLMVAVPGVKIAIMKASLCFEKSKTVVKVWKQVIVTLSRKSKLQRRITLKSLKALLPIRFYCGSVGIVRNRSKIKYLEHSVKNTIDLCLFLRNIT